MCHIKLLYFIPSDDSLLFSFPMKLKDRLQYAAIPEGLCKWPIWRTFPYSQIDEQ